MVESLRHAHGAPDDLRRHNAWLFFWRQAAQLAREDEAVGEVRSREEGRRFWSIEDGFEQEAREKWAELGGDPDAFVSWRDPSIKFPRG